MTQLVRVVDHFPDIGGKVGVWEKVKVGRNVHRHQLRVIETGVLYRPNLWDVHPVTPDQLTDEECAARMKWELSHGSR